MWYLNSSLGNSSLHEYKQTLTDQFKFTYQHKIFVVEIEYLPIHRTQACRLQQEAGPTEKTAMVKTLALPLEVTFVGGRNVREELASSTGLTGKSLQQVNPTEPQPMATATRMDPVEGAAYAINQVSVLEKALKDKAPIHMGRMIQIPPTQPQAEHKVRKRKVVADNNTRPDHKTALKLTGMELPLRMTTRQATMYRTRHRRKSRGLVYTVPQNGVNGEG